ncbi:hypothetical protein [Collimonas humicola]|uniref:hypothetical protein n=1 Tax=Collimonas humicola TaxID=2825886 RepID=UPI001B8B1B04|nr:hypothetical protein [Collimonas humicola]
MHSEIHIENIFAENTEAGLFLIMQCQVVNGAVQIGANVSLPFSAGIDMTIPVDGIEVIADRHIKIKVRCEDSAEIDFLLGLDLNGESLLVE